MKSAPNSKANLDRAIYRFAGDFVREAALRTDLANAIVAQMIGEGVVKGGSGLKFRYGEKATRVTKDLDTAWTVGLDEFLKGLKAKLHEGWNGFDGEVIVKKQGSPVGIPFEYVMQPCDVKLNYRGKPWFTVQLEVGHNEIGDADGFDLVEVPDELAALFDFLCLPRPAPVRVMKLEYQIAQKLHGASGKNSARAHDLIDLQLIMSRNEVNLELVRTICQQLFRYRREQSWPPTIAKSETWDTVYSERKGSLEVLPTVDEAVSWANDLIAKIDESEDSRDPSGGVPGQPRAQARRSLARRATTVGFAKK